MRNLLHRSLGLLATVSNHTLVDIKTSGDALLQPHRPHYDVQHGHLLSPKRPFVTARHGRLQLEDGTPFRFASLNAPELFQNTAFEVEDTMRTMKGFGRAVTRTYTLRMHGTSPYANEYEPHIVEYDRKKQDWVYREDQFRQVPHKVSSSNALTLMHVSQMDFVLAVAARCTITTLTMISRIIHVHR